MKNALFDFIPLRIGAIGVDRGWAVSEGRWLGVTMGCWSRELG
jgi:hypothetical protein